MDVNNDGLLDLVMGNCFGYCIFQLDNCELVFIIVDYDNDGIVDVCDVCFINFDFDCIFDFIFFMVSLVYSVFWQWNELLLVFICCDLVCFIVYV